MGGAVSPRDQFVANRLLSDKHVCLEVFARFERLLGLDLTTKGRLDIKGRTIDNNHTFDITEESYEKVNFDSRKAILDLRIRTLTKIGNFEYQSRHTAEFLYRMEYYLSTLSWHAVKKGVDPIDGKVCVQLVFCDFDPLGQGHALYIKKNTVWNNDPTCVTDTKYVSVLVNLRADMTKTDLPEEIVNIILFWQQERVDNDDKLTVVLGKLLAKIRSDADWSKAMEAVRNFALENYNDGRVEGRVEGRAEGRVEGHAEGVQDMAAAYVDLLDKMVGKEISEEAYRKLVEFGRRGLAASA